MFINPLFYHPVWKSRKLCRTKRVYEIIPASKYAVWRAMNKPPRINERRFKRFKNKVWKIFARKYGLSGRVKTHTQGVPSVLDWTYDDWRTPYPKGVGLAMAWTEFHKVKWPEQKQKILKCEN